VALVCVGAIILNPTTAAAFKAKAHLGVANTALSELDPTFRNARILGLGNVPLQNDEVMDAIRAYPEHFRAGALGPDSFPDLVAGQLWVHVNNGCPDGPPCTAPGLLAADVPLENRSTDKWRAIDYGMYQLRQALLEPAGPSRQQALAFAYGYLAHEMSDGFAHAWVNEWTRDFFTIYQGGGLFGPMTEELQHIALEGYLDKHLVAGTTETTIGTPIEFLNRVYLGAIGEPGVVGSGPAGTFAGPHYEALIKLRNLFDLLSDRNNWADAVDPTMAHLLTPLLDASKHLDDVSIGPSTLTIVSDIEDYFGRRRDAIDAVLGEWVALSGCISQNLVAAGSLPPGTQLTIDACQAIDFEPSSNLRDIFDGALNEAAWFGKDEPEFDYGSLGHNAHKILKFVQELATFTVRMSILRDVKSIRELIEKLDWCDTQLVQWGTCQNACDKAGKVCSEVAYKAVCLACPPYDPRKRPDCGSVHWYGPDWKMWACIGNPVCFACESNWVDDAVESSCLTMRDQAVPICAVCATDSGVCRQLEVTRDLVTAVPDAIDRALQPLVDRIKDYAVNKLMEMYLGPELEAFYDAYKELDRGLRQTTPAWAVNIAFLREDLRADPAHLNRIITSLLGISETVVDNSLEIGAAISDTTARTAGAARTVLKTYLNASDDQAYDRIWEGLVTILYRVARDPQSAVNLVAELEQPAYAWLDAVSFKTPRSTYERRFAKLLVLASELQLFSQIRGPTVKAFRAELGLDRLTDDFSEGEIDPHTVHPLHNSIEAVKLGFLGSVALDTLLGRAGDASVTRTTTSRICQIAPHIACDVIQSLDDPGSIRFDPSGGPLPSPDANLGLARWYSNKVQWTPAAGVFQDPARCVPTLTDYPLALTDARVATLYDAIFQYPPPCRGLGELRSAGSTATSIVLTWTFTDGAGTTVQIERSPGDGRPFVSIATTAAGADTYADPGLAPGTSYLYRVKGLSPGAASRYSNTLRARTQSIPVAPGGFTATAINANQVKLSWIDNASDETSYRIERRSGAGAYTVVALVPRNSVTWTDTGLTPQTTYTYRLAAVGDWGDSPAVVASAATTLIPAPPSHVTAARDGMGLRVAWRNESSSAAGIVLLRKSPSSATWAPVETFAARDGAYTDVAIQPGITYAYRLQSYDAGGQPSAMSEEATGSQLPGSAPSGLLVTQDGMGLKLTWTNNASNATGIQVFKRVGPNGAWTEFVAAPMVPSVTDTEVTAGEIYYYAVRAWAPGGVTELSAPAAGFQSAAAAPTDLVALQDGMAIRLSWTGNAYNAAGSRVFRRTGSGAWTLHATIPGAVTSYLDVAVTFGERYSYYVDAYTSAENVTFASNVASGTQDPAAAPSGFYVEPQVGGVLVSWTNHARYATGTQVFRKLDVNGTWGLAASVTDPTAASYLDTDVAIGRTYFYFARSYVAPSNAATADSSIGGAMFGECDLAPSSVAAVVVVDGVTRERPLPTCTGFPHKWPSPVCSGGVCR
jgi:hypothetical protein